MSALKTRALATMVLLTACAPSLQTTSAMPSPTIEAGASLATPLPARFSGVLPCADCEGIRYDVDLRGHGVYFMRLSYVGRSGVSPVDRIGQWSLVSETNTLVLRGAGDESDMFSIVDASILRKLDREGKRIESRLNYEITRQVDYVPIEPDLRMQGMYRYMADAGLFEECLTGLRLPVATEDGNAALEAAYIRVRSEPGAPVLARLLGRIVSQPGMEGDRIQPTLIVHAVEALAPNESCGARGVTHDLAGTRWVLVRLGQQPVVLGKDAREPFIALETASPSVAGFDGCNRLMGAYKIDGERIEFTKLAMTLMACPDMQVADAFAKALAATERWKIDGAHLELRDAAGTVQARFESRNL